VPAPLAAPATAPVAAVAVPAVPAGPAPAAALAEEADDVVVVPLADVEATAWVQTRERRPLAQPPLPSQAPSPFVSALQAAGADEAEYGAPAEGDDEVELIGVLGAERSRHVA
jgi:hypothetical protein